MKNFIFGLGVALALLMVTGTALATSFGTFQGGTGTSSPSGILAGDNNATNHLNTVVIGSNLTWDGTTLSASGGSGITDLGLGFGATTTGPKVTLATTTSTTNGLTYALTITNSGTKFTFAPSVSGTYNGQAGSVANSLSTSGSITGTSFNGSAAVSDWAINMANSNFWTARQNFTNATSSGLEATSTNIFFDSFTSAVLTANSAHQLTAYAGTSCTNQFVRSLSALAAATCASVSNSDIANSTIDLTAKVTGVLPYANGGTGTTTAPQGQLLYGGATAYQSVATSSVAVSAGLNVNSGTLGSQIGGSAVTLGQTENRGFSYATTTAWTGTTTISLGVGYGEKWQNMKCYTDVGTLNVDFYHATTHFQFFNASTTIGTVNMANTTDTSGDKVKVDIGTPATAPAVISCTLNDTI